MDARWGRAEGGGEGGAGKGEGRQRVGLGREAGGGEGRAGEGWRLRWIKGSE